MRDAEHTRRPPAPDSLRFSTEDGRAGKLRCSLSLPRLRSRGLAKFDRVACVLCSDTQHVVLVGSFAVLLPSSMSTSYDCPETWQRSARNGTAPLHRSCVPDLEVIKWDVCGRCHSWHKHCVHIVLRLIFLRTTSAEICTLILVV